MRVPGDAVHPHTFQEFQRRVHGGYRSVGGVGVLELFGAGLEPKPVARQRLGNLAMAEAVGGHPLQVLGAHIERRAAEVGVQPLVAVAAGEVDLFVVQVGGEGAPRLDRVGVEVGAVRMGEVGQRRQVVAEAVPVRYPGHADQAGAPVGVLGKVVDRNHARARRDDPQLDPVAALEFPVQDKGRHEMQFVHHHVVARPPVQSARDDVLGPAGRIQERDLVLLRPEETGKARPGARDRFPPGRRVAAIHLPVGVIPQGVPDGSGQRAHRGRVEVGLFLGDGEAAADAERVVVGTARGLRRIAGRGLRLAGTRVGREAVGGGQRREATCGGQRCEPGGGRRAQEASAVQ